MDFYYSGQRSVAFGLFIFVGIILNLSLGYGFYIFLGMFGLVVLIEMFLYFRFLEKERRYLNGIIIEQSTFVIKDLRKELIKYAQSNFQPIPGERFSLSKNITDDLYLRIPEEKALSVIIKSPHVYPEEVYKNICKMDSAINRVEVQIEIMKENPDLLSPKYLMDLTNLSKKLFHK